MIWLDSNRGKNEDNSNLERRLQDIDSSLQIHSTIEDTLDYIREVNPQNVFIIISGSYGELAIHQIDQISTITFVCVFCHDKLKHERWAVNHEKIRNRIFSKKDDLLRQLDQDVQRYIRAILPISILRSDAKHKTFWELSEGRASFIWFQLLIDELIHLPRTESAKKELIDICRARYPNEENKLIQEFAMEYCEADASRWYSRDSPVYRLLNRGSEWKTLILFINFVFSSLISRNSY